MKKVIVSFIVSLCLFAGQTKAQDTLSIAAGGQIFNLPTFANYNDSATPYIYIKNVSTTSYSGYITFQIQVDSAMSGSFDTVQTDSALVFLNPNDSFPISFFEIFTPLDYRVGGNIVVIWPSASNAFFNNAPTMEDTVYILGFAGIENMWDGELTVYPVPFQHSLHIVLPPGHHVPEKIILRDVTGRVVFEAPYSELANIPESISTGTYFLELQFRNARSKTARLMKMK